MFPSASTVAHNEARDTAGRGKVRAARMCDRHIDHCTSCVRELCTRDTRPHVVVRLVRRLIICLYTTRCAERICFVARPTLLVLLGRGAKTDFFIRNLTPDEVDVYNKATAAQGNLLIVPSNAFPISKLLMPQS